MSIVATYYGSSGWLLKFGDFSVLVDPWLTGPLSFPPGPWLIEGNLVSDLDVPKRIDLVLLTQGLADHSHPLTLKSLNKSIQVVGSASASAVAKKIGFINVIELRPGKVASFNGLTIEATAGAPVPNVENGYILSHLYGSLYLEPHGYMDENIKPRKLDAVISPVVDLRLPLVGSFIRGKSVLPKLISKFNPLTVFASTVGGNMEFTGFLNNLIRMDGSPIEAARTLKGNISLIDPIPGKTYLLNTYSQ